MRMEAITPSQIPRLAASHSSHPTSNCRAVLPLSSLLPASIEHKLCHTEGIQDKFVKHHVRPFLVSVSPGDPWLGSWNIEQHREEADTNLPRIRVERSRYFCLKDRQLRNSYLIPAAQGTVGKERYFCNRSSAFPMQLGSYSHNKNPRSNNTLQPTTATLQASCTVVTSIQLPFDCLQACDI